MYNQRSIEVIILDCLERVVLVPSSNLISSVIYARRRVPKREEKSSDKHLNIYQKRPLAV
jgi:hypothetical protein